VWHVGFKFWGEGCVEEGERDQGRDQGHDQSRDPPKQQQNKLHTQLPGCSLFCCCSPRTTATPSANTATTFTPAVENYPCSAFNGRPHCCGRPWKPNRTTPLLSELETNKPVKARFRLCLEPFSVRKSFVAPNRYRANSAHIRQSRPESGLSFQVKTVQGVASSLGSGGTAVTNGPRKPNRIAPLSSELETHKPVKARFWLCLEPFSVRKSVNPSKLFPLRSETVTTGIPAHAPSLLLYYSHA